MARPRRDPFTIGTIEVGPGKRATTDLPIAHLVSGTPVTLPVLVLHGRSDGPCVWISAAIHGDELCGVEIVRRVVASLDPRAMAGTLIAVPVVNVHGFNRGDRYLPDRRDLNRAFPGSPRGSLAARVAHLLMTEVVSRCSVGIDLHTGSDHRRNLPQIRANLDDPDTLELAEAFAPPIAVHARLRDGSLRQAATEAGAAILVYEGGEALRFDEPAIERGKDGIRRVLGSLGMVAASPPAAGGTLLSRRSRWLRASRSGIVHLERELGDRVDRGDPVGVIVDTFGKRISRLTARADGIVIGATQHPLVNQGDAVVHIAEIDGSNGTG
jgi:predicted deacylase